jgi:hypothetical protein
MTLEDKLLDRLQRLTEKYYEENQDKLRWLNRYAQVREERDNLKIQYNQVESAHTKLVKYTKELESKLSRKGKRGK